MAKYTCSKTKDEILEIIAEEFGKVNKIMMMQCRTTMINSKNGIRVDM